MWSFSGYSARDSPKPNAQPHPDSPSSQSCEDGLSLKRFGAEYVFMPDADFRVERDGTMVGGVNNADLWAGEMKHWLGIRGSVEGGGLKEIEWQRRPLTYSEQTSDA